MDGSKDIVVPVFDVQGNYVDNREVNSVDSEEFLLILEEIQGQMKKKPPLFEVLQLYYRDVCPMSLIDNDYDQIMLWEAFSQEYGGYPFPGSLFEQPNKLIDAYLTIMIARNEYYRVRDEKIKSKMDRENKQQRNMTQGIKGIKRF